MSSHVIQNVRVFDGFNVLPSPSTVVVEDGIITFVGPDLPKVLPSNANVTDGEGCTLIPGLIDAHTHVFRGVDQVKEAIKAGVTTVFDMHNEPSNAIYMKDLASKTSALPDIFSAFHSATVDGGWPRAIVRHTNTDPKLLATLNGYPKLSTAEDAVAYVKKNKAMGADFIKLMQESGECLTLSNLPAPTKALQKAVIDAAHDLDLLTFAHATNIRETMLVLDAGADALAHQFFDRPHTEELVQLYEKNNAFLIPTLTAISSMMGLTTARDWLSNISGSKLLGEAERHSLCDCMKISKPGCSIEFAYSCIRALKQKGINVVCGTDSGPSIHGTALGAAVHLELSLYVQHCGFTAVEALRSATGLSARRLRLHDRGHVAVGKRADLVLIRGDPTQRIGESTQVENVWKKGEVCQLE